MTLKKLKRLSLSLLQFFAQKSNWICQEVELNYHRFSPWNAEICTHFDWSVVTIFWRQTHWWPHHCFLFFLLSNQTSMLSLVCTVTDHRVRQNVVGPSVKNLGAQLSVSSVYRGKLTSDVIIQTGVNQCEI